MKLFLFLAGLLLLCLLAVASHARFFIQMQGGQGPPPPLIFTSITMSQLTFVTGAAGGVGTATATVRGAAASPTWSLKTTGTDTATGTQCQDYSADFSINSSTGAVSNAAGAPAQNYPGFCVQAAQAGLVNTPFSAAFQLVGSVVSAPVSTFDITRNAGSLFTFSTDKLTATVAKAASAGNNVSAFTSGFHSDVKRFFRFVIGTQSTGCTQGIGLATTGEANGSSGSGYLGDTANSLGLYDDGEIWLGGAGLGRTGLSWVGSSNVDVIVDPVAKTAVLVVNGGAPSQPIDISGLSSQSVSPAISPCAANDSVAFNGNPAGVSYPGAIAWDAPIGGAGVSVVRGITSHSSTTVSGNTVTWNLPSAIGGGNTVVAYSHQSTPGPTSITDNAGNSYILSSTITWSPYNEPVLMWYKVGVTGNPTQIFINYPGSPPANNFCDCGIVEYSGATAVDITGPIEQAALNPSMTISPTAASSLIWAFNASDVCQGSNITPSGYLVLIDDCSNDGITVLGSPAAVGPGPITFTWHDTFFAGPTCSDGTTSSSCSMVMMGAAIHGGPPKFTGIAMSNLTFTAGSTSPVGTATASVSSGTTTPTWSLKLSGTDSSGTTCVDNSSHFAINSATGVVAPNLNDAAQSYPGTCIQADQAGFTNTPFSQAFTLTGSSTTTPLTIAFSPVSPVTEACNGAAGLVVSGVTVAGGNGNPVTLSLTAGGTDFALSSFSPPANVVIGPSGITTSGFACGSLPGGGANETVTVNAAQAATGGGSTQLALPPAAAAAGLTTLALGNDWTQGLPSAAGTGLTLPAGAAANTDCVGGAGCWYMQASSTACGPLDALPHVWYAPETGQCSPVQESEPTGGGVHLLIDNDPTFGSGQYAEDFSSSLAQQEQQGAAGLRISTKNCCNVGNTSSNLFSDYPMASYTEVVARANDEDAFCASPSNCGRPNFDFFTWAADSFDAGVCVLELDDIELWGKINFVIGGGGGINWCTSPESFGGNWSGYAAVQSKLGANFTTKAYHKYAQLITSDGTTIESCSLIDDVVIGCNSPVPPTPYAAIGARPDNTGSVAQRRDLILWSLVNHGALGSNNINQCPDNTGTWASWCVQFPAQSAGFSTSVGQLGSGLHVLVKSIQVRSCVDWPRGSTGPNPNCLGQATLTTDPNGLKYYKVVTQ